MVDITLTGIGQCLFETLKGILLEGYPTIITAWQQDLCDMLSSNQTLSCAHSLVSCIPLNFPKASVLVQYLHPIISDSMSSNLLAALVPYQPDIPKLAQLYEELFVWGDSMGIIQNFFKHVFLGLAIRKLLYDLCNYCGLIQSKDTSFSPHAIISKACLIHENQHQWSQSEIFISLIIPSAVVSQITSAITGTNDTSATREKLKKWQERHEVHVWLSCILALHARPDILDDNGSTHEHKDQSLLVIERGDHQAITTHMFLESSFALLLY